MELFSRLKTCISVNFLAFKETCVTEKLISRSELFIPEGRFLERYEVFIPFRFSVKVSVFIYLERRILWPRQSPLGNRPVNDANDQQIFSC
jgi:hypothetical protein